MATFISILIFLACILLILIVLVQNPKGGGLSSEFSGAERMGDVQQTADFLERATWTLAIGVMFLTLVQAGFMGSDEGEESERSPLEEVVNEQMERGTPATPDQMPSGQGGGQGAGQGNPAPSQGDGNSSSPIEEAVENEEESSE